MKNKLFSLLLMLALVLTMYQPASAAAPFAGSGTRKDPYRISSSEELQALAQQVNQGELYEDTYFRQTCDIDLAPIVWIPIGDFDTEYAFCGTYDGDGHVLWNLHTNAYGNNGLFGKLGGTVMNLTIGGGTISGTCSGSFSSHAYGSEAVILNCSSTASVSGYRAGGIADNFNGLIANCWTDCSLSAAEEGSVGGIVSYFASRVYNSFARGDYNPDKLIQYKGVTMLTPETTNTQLMENLNSALYASAKKADIDPRMLNYWILNDAGIPYLSSRKYQYHLSDLPQYLVSNLTYIVPAGLALCGTVMLLTANGKIRKKQKFSQS